MKLEEKKLVLADDVLRSNPDVSKFELVLIASKMHRMNLRPTLKECMLALQNNEVDPKDILQEIVSPSKPKTEETEEDDDEEETDEANVLIAIRSYYGALINYLLTNLKVQFEGVENVPNFPEAVPIVIGGGTSLVKGFLDVFNEQFDQDEFPIPISEIVHIEDAHTAVARGCLSEAQLIEEDDE